MSRQDLPEPLSCPAQGLSHTWAIPNRKPRDVGTGRAQQSGCKARRIRELPQIVLFLPLCARQTQGCSFLTFPPCTTSPSSAKGSQEAVAAVFALQFGICRGFPGGRCNLSPGLPGELPACRSVARPQHRPFATFSYPNRIYEQGKSQRPPYSLARGHRSPGFPAAWSDESETVAASQLIGFCCNLKIEKKKKVKKLDCCCLGERKRKQLSVILTRSHDGGPRKIFAKLRRAKLPSEEAIATRARDQRG